MLRKILLPSLLLLNLFICTQVKAEEVKKLPSIPVPNDFIHATEDQKEFICALLKSFYEQNKDDYIPCMESDTNKNPGKYFQNGFVAYLDNYGDCQFRIDNCKTDKILKEFSCDNYKDLSNMSFGEYIECPDVCDLSKGKCACKQSENVTEVKTPLSVPSDRPGNIKLETNKIKLIPKPTGTGSRPLPK